MGLKEKLSEVTHTSKKQWIGTGVTLLTGAVQAGLMTKSQLWLTQSFHESVVHEVIPTEVLGLVAVGLFAILAGTNYVAIKKSLKENAVCTDAAGNFIYGLLKNRSNTELFSGLLSNESLAAASAVIYGLAADPANGITFSQIATGESRPAILIDAQFASAICGAIIYTLPNLIGCHWKDIHRFVLNRLPTPQITEPHLEERGVEEYYVL
jgi:hypothetical protein